MPTGVNDSLTRRAVYSYDYDGPLELPLLLAMVEQILDIGGRCAVAVVVFQDDDVAYLDWRERHEATGYVLTLPRQQRERPAMLHAARC